MRAAFKPGPALGTASFGPNDPAVSDGISKSVMQSRAAEATEGGHREVQAGATIQGDASDVELLRELVWRLGGEHSLVEHLTTVLEGHEGAGGALNDEDTIGYCYLKLFDRVEHRDAALLGPRPTVADLRRFSNGRANPFGLRTVIVSVAKDEVGRLAHISYRSGGAGLRPVEALSALSKDCRVGGLPDGVTDDFPPSWIPAELHAAQTWDYIVDGSNVRPLDLLGWVGDRPSWLDQTYEPISAHTSRVRWTLRADPLGPLTGTIDVIDSAGKAITVRSWTSYVAHTGYHQRWRVRGTKVFAEAMIWRAARVLSDPRSPAPTPTPSPGHGDLLLQVPTATREVGGRSPGGMTVLPKFGADIQGYCYAKLFYDENRAIWNLGAYPSVGDVKRYRASIGEAGNQAETLSPDISTCVLVKGDNTQRGHKVHHVSFSAGGGEHDFWSELESVGDDDLLGATMSDTARPSGVESIDAPAALVLRPKQQGITVSIPFVAALKAGEENLLWDITTGKKFEGIGSHFESVELVSLSARVTIHKGDNDTLVTLAADTTDTQFTSETQWIGAPHTLMVSGNVNGATTGEMKLEGNHGFGTQLKGLSVGNPTPIVQVKLETTVAAIAYIKFIMVVRVCGTGHPTATVLKGKPTKGGLNGVGRARVSPESDGD